MTNMWPEFEGRKVLVTGGSNGIGLGTAQAFQAAGAVVHITGTRASAADYADDLSGFRYVQAKFDQPGAAEAVAKAVGELDVLVNNAGMGGNNEYTPDGFRATINVNLLAVMDMCLACYPTLRKNAGAIVNVGSLSSFLGLKETPAYTASKAGILGLTRALADKWARDPVRVNMVAPGFIRTRMTSGLTSKPEVEAKLVRAIPNGRLGVPDDIAQSILFLASPRASYIVGQSIVIDGGLMLR